MHWWLLFIIVGSLCAISLGLFVGKKESPSKYSETFKKEVENLGKQFSKENQTRIDEERKKVEQSLKEYVNNCEIQRQIGEVKCQICLFLAFLSDFLFFCGNLYV